MSPLLASLAVGAGLALLTVAFLRRVEERDLDLAAILDLPYGEHDVAIEAVTGGRTGGRTDRVGRTLALASAGLERLDLVAHLAATLQAARVPLRPGEAVLAALGASVAGALLGWLLTGSLFLGGTVVLACPAAAWAFLRLRAGRRRKAFEAQLPEALSLIASSLEAGHTPLRSIQSMVEESEAPLSEEFARVVAETSLGDSLVDALQRLSDRLSIPDLAWVVQAVRIQQSVGGKLADILYTLAEFMRAREEIRREVRVLTAEGRMSAYILGALPIGIFVFLKVTNPTYIAPMFSGNGLIALIGAGVSVVIGITTILRMAKVEV